MTKLIHFVFILLLVASVFAELYDTEDDGDDELTRYKRQARGNKLKGNGGKGKGNAKSTSSEERLCQPTGGNMVPLINCVQYCFFSPNDAKKEKCIDKTPIDKKAYNQLSTNWCSCLWMRMYNRNNTNGVTLQGVGNIAKTFTCFAVSKGILSSMDDANINHAKLEEYLVAKHENAAGLPIAAAIAYCKEEDRYLRKINPSTLVVTWNGQKIDLRFFFFTQCLSCYMHMNASLQTRDDARCKDSKVTEKMEAGRKSLGTCLETVYTLPLVSLRRKKTGSVQTSPTPQAEADKSEKKSEGKTEEKQTFKAY